MCRHDIHDIHDIDEQNDFGKDDEYYMREALAEAMAAADAGEVPIGAVIVCDGEIIARGKNSCESDRSAVRHAEIAAIEEACRVRGGWRLSGCTLYVTLEPCPMCAGAIINSRVTRVVYGAKDPRAGAFGSVLNLRAYPFACRPYVLGGILADDCARLLSEFFARRRQ